MNTSSDAHNVTNVTGSPDNSTMLLCAVDADAVLLVDVASLMQLGLLSSCVVLLLMLCHYTQSPAQAATRAVAADEATFRFDIGGRTFELRAAHWGWLRRLDWPFLEAEFEGDAFYAFVITSTLEAILNATSLANTHLEGDLQFANDPAGMMVVASWLLTLAEMFIIAVLIAQVRRTHGRRCWCLPPYDTSSKAGHHLVLVQGVTWCSLAHDAFQITIEAVATASQV